jgi:hypothetical protein
MEKYRMQEVVIDRKCAAPRFIHKPLSAFSVEGQVPVLSSFISAEKFPDNFFSIKFHPKIAGALAQDIWSQSYDLE